MGLKFDRKKFFDGVKERLDPTLNQEQVDGFEFLLGRFEKEPRWNDVRLIAYAFATIWHETAYSMQPVEEGYYLGSKARVQKFQKTLRYYPFFGRGYVQLTWPTNYEKAGKALGVDLKGNPNLALDPDIAFKVLTEGLFRGWFGGKLATYINAQKTDYVNARRCVNILDKAGLIAGYAKSFEKILNASKTSAADPNNGAEKPGVNPHDPPPINTVPVTAPEPYMGVGFWGVIKRDLTLATGGNLTFEGLSQYAQQASGWPEWVVAIIGKVAVGLLVVTAGYFIFRVIHYLVDTWKKNEKTKTEAAANTSKDRFSIEWS